MLKSYKTGVFFCAFLDHHINRGKNSNTVLNSPQIQHTEWEKKEHLTQEKQSGF